MILALLLASSEPIPGVFGMGQATCKEAITLENYKRAGDFVWGFWSGMNVAANTPSVGKKLGPHEIFKQVAEACLQEPTLPLSLAILAVHMRAERLKQ